MTNCLGLCFSPGTNFAHLCVYEQVQLDVFFNFGMANCLGLGRFLVNLHLVEVPFTS